MKPLPGLTKPGIIEATAAQCPGWGKVKGRLKPLPGLTKPDIIEATAAHCPGWGPGAARFDFNGWISMNHINQELIETLAVRLRNSGITVAAAESLTGGRVASALTSAPGSSAYFQGAIVAYSNQLKVELLGVPFETILKHGAVSEECARAMAEGARRKLGVDAAVAATGIAGPDGGSSLKPVGLVWLAVSDGVKTITGRHVFEGDRDSISSAATAEALLLLSSFVQAC